MTEATKGLSRPHRGHLIRDNYEYLCKSLDGADLTDFLFQHGVISSEDKKCICEEKTKEQRSLRLLECLQDKSGSAEIYFLKSLEKNYNNTLKHILLKDSLPPFKKSRSSSDPLPVSIIRPLSNDSLTETKDNNSLPGTGENILITMDLSSLGQMIKSLKEFVFMFMCCLGLLVFIMVTIIFTFAAVYFFCHHVPVSKKYEMGCQAKNAASKKYEMGCQTKNADTCQVFSNVMSLIQERAQRILSTKYKSVMTSVQKLRWQHFVYFIITLFFTVILFFGRNQLNFKRFVICFILYTVLIFLSLNAVLNTKFSITISPEFRFSLIKL